MKNFFARQRQDGFCAIRLKSAAGKLTTAQLAAINNLAEKFGDGFVTLTSRQEISIPFVLKENVDAVKDFCAANDLQISLIGTVVKIVTACQGKQTCPAGIIDSPKIALDIDGRHGGRELPCKLTCSVTGCPNNCMKVHANDLGIAGAIEPQFVRENCVYCGACAKVCPVGAITVDRAEKIWTIDRDKCINCGRCVKVCRRAALRGDVGFKIYFAGKNFLPIVRDEETLQKIIDAAINFFAENAKPRERFGKVLERLNFTEQDAAQFVTR